MPDRAADAATRQSERDKRDHFEIDQRLIATRATPHVVHAARREPVQKITGAMIRGQAEKARQRRHLRAERGCA